MTTSIPASLFSNPAGLSAKAYGAKGDGAAIDDAAIQGALDAMAARGGGGGGEAVPMDTSVSMVRIAGSFPI